MPGLAVVLLARADEIRDIDGRRRLRCIRKQQHPEAIGEGVLRDPLDGRALRDAGGDRGLGSAGEKGEKGGDEEPESAQMDGQRHGGLDDEKRGGR